MIENRTNFYKTRFESFIVLEPFAYSNIISLLNNMQWILRHLKVKIWHNFYIWFIQKYWIQVIENKYILFYLKKNAEINSKLLRKCLKILITHWYFMRSWNCLLRNLKFLHKKPILKGVRANELWRIPKLTRHDWTWQDMTRQLFSENWKE
jgi:hypothetical protein